MYAKYFKRWLDLIIAAMLVVLLFPLLILVGVFIKLDSPGPILYKQVRLGLNGKIFCLYKFRSMVDAPRIANKQIYLGDSEITVFGNFIRRFKIDELPQLINVIKGDMSIVGPRPCLPDLQTSFDANGVVRIKVRPGLTGLAQVNGNVFLSWADRWLLDRTYVENINLALDVKILIKTVSVVVLGEKSGVL